MPFISKQLTRRRRVSATLLSSVFVLSLATACGDDEESGNAEEELRAATGEQDLSGACPNTVVVQADWEPEIEHGPIYNLVGPGYTVDSNQKRVTGPLVIDGVDTGVDIEVRAGGGAIGYQNIPSQMYLEQDIMLGMVSTDGAMNAAADRPVTAVFSLMDVSPQMLMWDPETHPDWDGIGDIGRTDEKVVYVSGSSYAPLLVDEGLVKESQLDASYDGSPSRFVADPSIAQQGYATAEPYIYENEVSAWGKPVEYQLLADVGYNIYPQSLSVRSDELARNTPCLEKLVPILQQSSVEFAADPQPAIDLVAEIVTEYNTGWVYTEETGEFGAQQMVDLGILANSAEGSIGSFDMGRVDDARERFTPIVTDSGAELPDDLTAEDLATNEFIDPKIALP
ncbi:hypothetical protein [Streptomyces sp. 6N223]|uniref:hypothetical protein n=1 Tax=Streptomyces sp. 6N223 TaxID=3457412 RepID=UPI003FD39CBC